MKRFMWYPLLAVFLAACQATPRATPAPVSGAVTVAAPPAKGATQAAVAVASPSIVPAFRQPIVHTSSSDPNASNVIAVRNQPISNSRITVDSLAAAQAGWVVVYIDRDGQPGHLLGFVPVPAGKSQNIVVPLDLTYVSNSARLAGRQLYAILQAGPQEPGTAVQEQGHSVAVTFMVVPGGSP